MQYKIFESSAFPWVSIKSCGMRSVFLPLPSLPQSLVIFYYKWSFQDVPLSPLHPYQTLEYCKAFQILTSLKVWPHFSYFSTALLLGHMSVQDYQSW